MRNTADAANLYFRMKQMFRRLHPDYWRDPYFEDHLTIRHRLCMACKRPLPADYEFAYCCSGHDCGCMGKPVEPWVCCDICDFIIFHRMHACREMWE